MNKMIDVVHDTIYQFFDVCGDDEEAPMSDKDKLLLEVNKTICNNLKALEQEPVLDKIRAEFMDRYPKNYAGEPEMGGMNLAFSLNQVLQIIDKYDAESESKEVLNGREN